VLIIPELADFQKIPYAKNARTASSVG
jgi:hypothetical protein